MVQALREGVVRASSVVENHNSRLRNYFFLRKEIGGGYLELLRFLPNKSARLLEQALKSALGNAEDRGATNLDDLIVSESRI